MQQKNITYEQYKEERKKRLMWYVVVGLITFAINCLIPNIGKINVDSFLILAVAAGITIHYLKTNKDYPEYRKMDKTILQIGSWWDILPSETRLEIYKRYK